MIPKDIIDAVRARLGDTKEQRWDDPTLLLYVSLCQSDICMFTHLYRRTSIIPLVQDQFIYELPTDFMALSRLEYNDKLFPVETRANIDRGETEFPCAVKDNLAYNQLEIVVGEQYDSLGDALADAFGVVTDSDTDAVAVDCVLDDIHGVVSDVSSDGLLNPSDPQPLDEVLLYYIAVPPLFGPLDIRRPLLVPDIWFQAFLHFVTGMALQDDNDANNIQRGELEAQKYTRLLEHIHAVSMNDFTTNAGSRLATSFRRT